MRWKHLRVDTLDVRPATWTFPLTAHAPRKSSILEKNKTGRYKKTENFFSIAGGLEIGAIWWSLKQETGYFRSWQYRLDIDNVWMYNLRVTLAVRPLTAIVTSPHTGQWVCRHVGYCPLFPPTRDTVTRWTLTRHKFIKMCYVRNVTANNTTQY